ncbi:putative acyl-CoA dehydrogenase [Gongronella butleri]|nr:putative acyl-CoA dehydrogenase [Gongronella butleri]
MKTFTVEEVAKHSSANDCWIIVADKVFDVTKFLSEHPGGKKVLVKMAGKDATQQFNNFHNDAIMERVGLPMQIGVIGAAGDAPAAEAAAKPAAAEEKQGPVASPIPYGDPAFDFNSPHYTESHIRLRKEMRAFVEKELMPFCHEWSEAKEVPKSVLKRCGEVGLLNAVSGAGTSPHVASLLPYGLPCGIAPGEFDIFHEFICVDELSRAGSGGLVWAVQGGLAIALPPVLHFGSDEMRQRVVPGVLSGDKVISLAITEPSAGSDVANLTTTAKDGGDHFVVNGEKKWITQGLYADFYVTACRTGGEGMGGISLLLIDRNTPGFNARAMDCQGMWGSGTSYLTMEDVKVPKANLIGEINQGFKYIMHNFNHERLGIVMQANRMARVCVEEAFKHALKRKTFGQPLVQHAVIRNKFGHCIRQVEATHAWLESIMYQVKTLPVKDQPRVLGGPIALLKAQATQTVEYCAREAAQIYGGLAYTRGGQGEKVERIYREVRAFAIPGGSEEIMLDLGVRQALKQVKL